MISPCKSQGRMVAVVDSKLERLERLLRRPPPPPPPPSVKLVDDKEHGVGGGEQTVLIGLGTCTEKNSDGNGCAKAVSGGEGPGHDQDGKGRSRSGGGLSRPPPGPGPGPYESLVRCCNLDCPQVNGDGLSEDASLDGVDGVASTDLCLRRAGLKHPPPPPPPPTPSFFSISSDSEIKSASLPIKPITSSNPLCLSNSVSPTVFVDEVMLVWKFDSCRMVRKVENV